MVKKLFWGIVAVLVIVIIVLILYAECLKRELKSISFSENYLVGFDYSAYSDVFGMEPIIICKIKFDQSVDAFYKTSDENGVVTEITKNYKLTDEQFENIKAAVNQYEIYKLDPKCEAPKDVCDGGDAWIFLYGADDELLKKCGGFCPNDERFNEIRRVLFDNLPDDLISEYDQRWE